MDIIDILRSKSSIEVNYLLKDHIKETILRALQFKYFVDQNKSFISYNFDEDFIKNLIFACFLHDLGKINWRFQYKLFSKEEKKYNYEKNRFENEELNNLYEFFKGYTDIDIEDHEIISIIYSLIFLDNDEWSQKIRTAILLHHYNYLYSNSVDLNIVNIFDNYPDLKKYIEFLIKNNERIKSLSKSLVDNLSKSLNNDYVNRVLEELVNNLDFRRLENLNKSLEDSLDISKNLKLFKVPDKENEKFYEFFIFLGCFRRCDYSASGNVNIEETKNLGEYLYNKINEKIRNKIGKKEIWQEKVLSKNDFDNLILIAPTGSGKTEFALLWAKNRGRKLIYTLPLRVALNDLYWRFSNKKNGYFEENMLSILHSTSFIEYLKEERNNKYIDIDEKQTISELFSSPMILTTPDQVFLSSLKYYGFDKVFSIYPISAIVIDEIQTYNPEMAAIIIKTIEMIKETKGNLLIITATFPPYFENFLKHFKKIDLKEELEETKNIVKNYRLKRHRIELIEKNLFNYNNRLELDEQSLKKINEILSNHINDNVLIIVNNVSKSIELYKKLKNENVYLLHSRLIEEEKSKRIKEIKEKLDRKERVILIATQIVEASVDLDFDILITEISTIDSQIQRWGRIYRNREKDYNSNEPNIFIFTGSDKGTKIIYDERVVEKSKEVLKNYINDTLDYEKEREIIEKTFEEKIDNDKTLKEIFIEEINKNLEYMKYYTAVKKIEAQRLFRRVSGIQVVIPELMKENVEDEIIRIFGEIVGDPSKRDISWEGIINKIKSIANSNKEINRWFLKKLLYDYSINIPIFYFEKHIDKLFSHEFKGFFVLKNLSKNDLENIKEYGLDSKFEIEKEEMDEYFNILL